MKHLTVKSEQQLKWRRQKVRELYTIGYNQRDIAGEMHLPLTTVNRDLKYSRLETEKRFEHIIDEYLPSEFIRCLDITDMIIKDELTSDIKDPRIRIMSRNLVKDCCAMRIDLFCHAKAIDRVIKFVNKLQGSTTQNDKVVRDDEHTEPTESR